MQRLKTKLLEGRYAEIVDKSGNFARYLLRRFIDDRCFESAGSLSYTSILAVVPFAAVVFAVFFFALLWGIPGALIGVPIMLTIIAFSAEFPSSRWVATLLSGASGGKNQC